MNDVTQILIDIENGDRNASSDLLPLVYEQLRALARSRMANERCDHTLQTTALVHEAYVRLVDNEHNYTWKSRGHFFAAAAESMRRILVEHARRANASKRGGGRQVQRIDSAIAQPEAENERILAVSDALEELQTKAPRQAELVKLRFFAGLTIEEAAAALEISLATAKRDWATAKVFIYRHATA
jgi:RNA polymerase sigma factor (TIGR02999 family)